IAQFQTSDCGTSMYCIATILTSYYFNLKDSVDTNPSKVFNELLTQLLKKNKESTTTQDLVGAIWSVAKLLQHGKLQNVDINEATLQQLLKAITRKISNKMNLSEIADTLW